MKLARIISLALLLVVVGAPAPAAAQGGTRTEPWDPEVVQLFESLPVQEGGRVKPMHTYAGFMLLRMTGKRSIETAAGERLSPVEWLLDTFFYPDAAADYPTFLIQNDEVLRGVGISLAGKKKRDRYSFNELRPGVPRLFTLAREYGAIEEKDRSSTQQQTFLLAININTYTMLLGNFDFARASIDLPESEELARIFEGRSTASFHEILERLGELHEAFQRLNREAGADPDELAAVAGVLREASELTDGTDLVAFIPPVEPQDEAPAWHSPADLFHAGLEHGSLAKEYGVVLAGLEELARSRDDHAAFLGELTELHGTIVGMAERIGAYEKVPLELTYYKSKVLDYSQYLFILSFLLMAFMWLRPRNKILFAGTSLTVLGATLFLVAAIVMRCMIRGRPPVSTLYETVLFVTAVGSIVAMFAESVNRQRIAISAAAVLGTIGLFIANGYEMLDKRDTMPSLVAVLDTNFWLATHVTAITIGYAAGMLAALLASLYLLLKLVGRWRAPRRELMSSLGRMVYGVLCFAMIFSLVGTVLGGIWANDSWGRFWGWDPKENGALLIVLSQLVILHARAGGYLREFGVCMAAALGGTVIGFSWWGVNLLGVGLHSYGFTSGIHTALWSYYVLQWGIVALGGVAWLADRASTA